MSCQVENINKKNRNLKRSQREILQLISKITEVENSLKLLSDRSEKTEERIRKLEHKSTKTIQSEEKRDEK